MERTVARKYMNGRTFLVQEEPRGPSQLIEIPITTNGLSEFSFPDVPELRNQLDQIVIIKAIRCIPFPALSVAPASGAANAPLTELVKMSLVIYCEGWNKGKNIPITSLIDIFIEGSGFPWRDRTTQLANWENVDWNKTKLQFSNGTVSAGQPYTVVIEVEYVKLCPEKDPRTGQLTGNMIEIVGPA